MHKFIITVITVSSIGISTAANADEANVHKERANSINVSPLGLLAGSYSANYERLFSGHHGLLLEGQYIRASDDDASSTHGGGGIGYRWHWRGRQNSGFLGATLAYTKGSGEGTVSITGSDDKTFDVDVSVLQLTGNIGKRWAWDSGLNITLRFGLGIGDYNVTTDSMDPDAEAAVKLVDDILTLFPVAFDGELSIGYTF